MCCTDYNRRQGKIYRGKRDSLQRDCNNQVNADEYHFLLVCTELKDLRAKYLSKCYQHNPSLLKLDQLMNLTSTVRLTHLSMYCKLVTDRVRCKIESLSFVHPSR